MMESGWWILTTRWGVDIVSPTTAQLQCALEEVFSAKDPEHPNSWLRFGHDHGPMFVLDVYESGTVVLEEWADTEFQLELAPPRLLTGTTPAAAMRLWQLLRQGDLPAVRSIDWSPER